MRGRLGVGFFGVLGVWGCMAQHAGSSKVASADVANSANAANSNSSGSVNDAGPGDPLTISNSIYDRSGLGFTPHTGAPPFGSYVVEDVSYPPAEAVRQQLEPLLPYAIQNRGEAHITVVTPPEYAKILAPHLSIGDIDTLVADAHIEAMPYTALCVGEGTATLAGKAEHTFYIVVDAPALVDLRHKIQDAFVAAGGDQGAFNADDFRPHITLGFTKRDLFEEDGVFKTTATCIRQLTFTQ